MSKKTEKKYYLRLEYLAPDHATDKEGEPVSTYKRFVDLTKNGFETMAAQLRKNNGGDVVLADEYSFSDGSKLMGADYWRLTAPTLMRATTIAVERLTEEEAEKRKSKGESILYGADGKLIPTIKGSRIN